MRTSHISQYSFSAEQLSLKRSGGPDGPQKTMRPVQSFPLNEELLVGAWLFPSETMGGMSGSTITVKATGVSDAGIALVLKAPTTEDLELTFDYTASVANIHGNNFTINCIDQKDHTDLTKDVYLYSKRYQPGTKKQATCFVPKGTNKIAIVNITLAVSKGDCDIVITDGEFSSIKGPSTFPYLYSTSNSSQVIGSPVVADSDHDGQVEVFISTDDKRCYLQEYNGQSVYFPKGWPVRTHLENQAGATLCDVDADGKDEYVVGSADGGLYAFRKDGSMPEGWPFKADAAIYSSPAVHDGRIFFGALDGKLYGINGDRSSVNGFPVTTGDWISAPPVIKDIDNNGSPELIFGSWDGKIYCYGIDNAQFKWSFDAGSPVNRPFSVGDMDGDNNAETAFVSGPGKISLLGLSGALLPGWPVNVSGATFTSTIMAEIGGFSGLTVIAATEEGSLHAFGPDGKERQGWPVVVDVLGNIVSSPIADDINNDGELEVLISTLKTGTWAYLGTGREMFTTAFPSGGGWTTCSPVLGSIDRKQESIIFTSSSTTAVRQTGSDYSPKRVTWFKDRRDLGNTACATKDTLTPVKEESLPKDITLDVFPNPVDSSANIRLEFTRPQELSIDVYDLLGRKADTVYRGKAGEGTFYAKWEPRAKEGIIPGVYFIRVISEEIISSRKVIVR